ncbi:hypothetical protein [Saccharomonospora azurea]|uniref:hypothetical protein n=1 Tax=Saccharomonospora azurea TaxID=40988 RepID=UPI003D8B45A0
MVVVDEPTMPNLSIEDFGIDVDGATTDTTDTTDTTAGDPAPDAPSAEEPESPLARRAKLIALLLAALALVGSMVVASMLAEDAGTPSTEGPSAVTSTGYSVARAVAGDATPSRVEPMPDFGDGARSVVNHPTSRASRTL